MAVGVDRELFPTSRVVMFKLKSLAATLALLGEPGLCRQCVILWGSSLGTEPTTGY